MLKILKASSDEGLTPEDYHHEENETIMKKIDKNMGNAELYANLDLLLTDATSLYANHLLDGKVAQSEIRKNWNIPQRETLKKGMTNECCLL